MHYSENEQKMSNANEMTSRTRDHAENVNAQRETEMKLASLDLWMAIVIIAND